MAGNLKHETVLGAVFIAAVFQEPKEQDDDFWPDIFRKVGGLIINYAYFCRGKTTWVSVCRPLTDRETWRHDIPSLKLTVCYLKIDGWNICWNVGGPSWDFADFQGRTVDFFGSEIRCCGTSAPNQGLSDRFPPNCSPRKPPRHSPRQARQSQEKYLPCQAAFAVVSGFLFNLLILFFKLHKKETFALKGFNGFTVELKIAKEKLNQCAACCKHHKSH